MPTDLPDVTAEFVLRFNEQQRELQALRHQVQMDRGRQASREHEAELAEFRSRVADLQAELVRQQRLAEEGTRDRDLLKTRSEELEAVRQALLAAQQNERTLKAQIAEQRRESDAMRHRLAKEKQSLESEIEGLKTQLQERVSTASTGAASSKATVPVWARGAHEPQAESSAGLLQKLAHLERENAALRKQASSNHDTAATETTVPPLELARKHKELRKKLTTYSERLADKRAFELSIASQLTYEQLTELVGALSKELTGMMERYQALSLWEKTSSADTV